jgi:hypothetical protein
MLRWSMLLLALGCSGFAAAQPTGADPAWEILYDAKVAIRLEQPRFTMGTKQLAWLAEAVKAKAGAKNLPAGPEHLEFREESSTLFKDGIITYIPLPSLLRLEYDPEKKLVKALVAAADGNEATLTGSLKFVGINKFQVEGVAQPSGVTIPAGPLAVQDGLLKTPIRGIRLRDVKAAKPVELPAGRSAIVIGQDKEKSEHRVTALTPLYRVGAGQRLAPVLMFQKRGHLDLDKIETLRQLPAAKKQTTSSDYEVTLAGGGKETLTLLEKTTLEDNQPAQLVGLVGRVAAGWKLFPPHTIAELRFGKE